MTREEAIINLKLSQNRIGGIKKEEWNALQMAIEALSAEEAVWNEYEAEFTDLPDIPRYYYEKVVGKMAHEINMLKEQLESADAEQGVGRYENAMQKLREMPRYLNGVKEKQITKISADAKPTITEEVREALMRLTMCAREECGMCKYKDECGFDFQYKISTENMNTILDAFISAEAVQGWIPCSERLPEKGEVVLITNGKGNVRCGQYRSEHDVRDGAHYWWWKGKTVETVLAWMPLPEPYKGGDTE